MSASLLKPATYFDTYPDLRYSNTATGAAGLLDWYVPKNKGPDGKPWLSCPLVIWIHGGYGLFGDKRDNIGFLYGLISKGFAVACINYRYSGSAARFPAQVQDVKCAIRGLHSTASMFRTWPNKFGLWGNSWGAYLAAMCALTNDEPRWQTAEWAGVSSAVAAAQVDSAPSNLLRWCTDPATPDPDQAVTELLGVAAVDDQAAARDASPIGHVSASAAPIWLWHGDRDANVPLAQSQELNSSLLNAGAPVSLQVVPGMGHGDFSYYTAQRVNEVASRFDAVLR